MTTILDDDYLIRPDPADPRLTERVSGVEHTERATDYEAKLKKKVQTSGCAQGTIFGDLMEVIENAALPQAELRTSWLYALTHKINTTPSLRSEERRVGKECRSR